MAGEALMGPKGTNVGLTTEEAVAKLEADLAEAEREAERQGPPIAHVSLVPGDFRETPAQRAHRRVDEIRRGLLSTRAQLEHEKRREAELSAAAKITYQALREHDHKYAYYKLTIAGAALTFALNQTHQVAGLSLSQLPLGAAVLSWGASLGFGFGHLKYARRAIIQGAQLSGASEASARAANRAGDAQLAFLIAGALLYVAWHTLEMYLRGVNAPRLL